MNRLRWNLLATVYMEGVLCLEFTRPTENWIIYLGMVAFTCSMLMSLNGLAQAKLVIPGDANEKEANQ